MRLKAWLMGSIAAASVACASPPATSRATVESFLSAYETVPSRDVWRALPGDVPSLLISIAHDPSELPSRRARALEVLGWFDSDRAVPAMRAALRNSDELPIVRAGAIGGLARALPVDQAVSELAPSLNDGAVSVRFRAALALRRMNTVPAKLALRSRALVETDASVRRVLNTER